MDDGLLLIYVFLITILRLDLWDVVSMPLN